MTSCVTLSRARPRKPFRSPAPIHRGRELAGSGVGYSLVDDLPGQRARPLGQPAAPGEAAAIVCDLAEGELDGRPEMAAEPQARAVGLPLPMVVIVERDFDARIDPLGVSSEEVQEPARHLVIRAARKHAGILASGAAASSRPSVLGGPQLVPRVGSIDSNQHSLKPHDRHFLQPSSYTNVAWPHSLQRSPICLCDSVVATGTSIPGFTSPMCSASVRDNASGRERIFAGPKPVG